MKKLEVLQNPACYGCVDKKLRRKEQHIKINKAFNNYYIFLILVNIYNKQWVTNNLLMMDIMEKEEQDKFINRCITKLKYLDNSPNINSLVQTFITDIYTSEI